MPRMKKDVVSEFLKQPHVGVIASLRRDGMPYSVPIWWLYDDEDDVFWLTGTTNRVWCKQLKQDPRCSLCIEAMAPVAGFVAVDGFAEARERSDFDIWPISRHLAEKYVGSREPDNPAAVDRFFNNMKTEPRLLFRLQPKVWRTIDMRVYRGKKADRLYQEAQAEGKDQ
ncbi:MAG: pyridoxamine 5'-phosphate oxidase family protein [Pseudomonadota bacterium]